MSDRDDLALCLRMLEHQGIIDYNGHASIRCDGGMLINAGSAQRSRLTANDICRVDLDGAVIEGGAMLATGGLLTAGKRIPAGQVWAGSPAKYWREVGPKDLELIEWTKSVYQDYAAKHSRACAAAGLLPDATYRAAGSD